MIVFSSFDPTDLRAEETSSAGIKHLRSYLEIAAHGPSALPFDGRRRPAIDRHREQIASALRERGFAVTTDVGLSDFKVDISVATTEEPNRPLMAVLLDSPAWAARATVGDRDGLPTDVLSRMLRWPAVERVWLPEWLVDSAAVLERLGAAMAAAQQVPAKEPEVLTADSVVPAIDDESGSSGRDERPESSISTALPAFDVEPAPDLHDELEPIRAQPTVVAGTTDASSYEPWTPRVLGGIDALDALTSSSRSRALVTTVVTQVIDTEGPIHTARLAKLTCAAFSLNKVSSQRANAVIRLIDQEKYRIDDDAFVWPLGMYSGRWRGYRENVPEVERKIEHVSKVEIANAMVAVCRGTHGIELEELKRRVIRIFGGMRVTAGIGERLDQAVQDAQSAEKLHIDGSGFVYAS